MADIQRAAEWVSFTPPFDVSGRPAIAVPPYWNDAGLPVGVHLVATHDREDLLIRVAAQLEATQPWAHLTPPAWSPGLRLLGSIDGQMGVPTRPRLRLIAPPRFGWVWTQRPADTGRRGSLRCSA